MTLHGLLVGLGIAVALWALAVGALFAFGHASTAKELVGLIPNLLLLFKDLAKDPRVPRGAKWWLLVGAVWIASPIDLLPEFLPVVGPLDDAIVAALILRHLVRKAGADVVADHWRGDPVTLERILSLFGTPRA
ncbi:MAG: YkvA family protein [Actinomycetota bacterium]